MASAKILGVCCSRARVRVGTFRKTVFGWAPDSAAYLGAICLHGPHHVAKKSTTTSFLPAYGGTVGDARSEAKEARGVWGAAPLSAAPWCQRTPQ